MNRSTRRLTSVATAVVCLLSGAACTTSIDESASSASRSPAPGRAEADWFAEWTTRAAGFPRVLASDADGTVSAGAEGGVVAIDRRGELQWATVVPGAPVVNPPVIVAGVVAIPEELGVVALDRATGAPRWSLSVARARLAAGDGEGGVVLVTGDDGVAILVDAATGSERWRAAFPAPVPEDAPHAWIVDDTAVLAWSAPGTDRHLLGLDLASGAPLWSARTTASSTLPVSHGHSVLVAESPGDDPSRARVVAFDARTGHEVWSTRLRGRYSPGLRADTWGDDAVFVDARGVLTLLDPATGRIRWRSVATYPQPEAAPVLAGNRVFMVAFQTRMVVLDRRTGEVLGTDPVSPPVFVRAAVGTGRRFEMLVESSGLGAVWTIVQERPGQKAGTDPPLH